MGKIRFVSDLESSVLKALKDAKDCADIKNDLDRIHYTITHGSEQTAWNLDYELRKKYPAIDIMLQAADALKPSTSSYFTPVQDALSGKDALWQDYYGIICDVAISKGIKEGIENCIDHIDF